ncbi:MAG: PKD domain-containing protein, partial [bacterium]
YLVTVTVTDSHNVFATASQTVTVTNVAPVITGFSTPPGSRTGAQAVVSFSDVGSADTHSAVITWGDGQTSTVDAGLAPSASATHAYANVGWYIVSATVTDDDGASVSTASQTLVIYDAAGGYTTASGKVHDLLRAHKTNFSHDVRYAGGTTPVGAFEIHGAPAGDMTSSAFEYLVVQGTTGTFKGTGTMTNGTPVTFLVRGIDAKPGPGGQDKVRIKVWNSATNAVIYDSQPNAAELATPTATVIAGAYNILH